MSGNKTHKFLSYLFLLVFSLSVLFFLVSRTLAVNSNPCNNNCECDPSWRCDGRYGNEIGMCISGTNPCPTQPPVIQPTAVPQKPPGGVTPPPGQPTLTPPPPSSNDCTANCSGTVCGDDTSSPCESDANCVSGNGYSCNLSTHYCQKCTTPGLSCCSYCVPQGWGCSGSGCAWSRSYKKVGCLKYGNDLSFCSTCTSIDGGGSNCQWAGEGRTGCNNVESANSCDSGVCSVFYGNCEQVCPVNPTPTPLPPPCSISNFTAVKNNSSCGVSTVGLNWTVNSPVDASYVTANYHNGGNWSQTGFSPGNPLSNTATQTTSPGLNPGGYNFEICCNKNNTNYGCTPQSSILMEACPTPTPVCNPPTNLTGSCAGPNGPITLNWTNSNNETYYKLSRRVNNVWIYDYINPISQNSITVNDTDVAFNKYNNSYDYNVWSCCGNASNCKYSANQPNIICPTPTPTPVIASCTGGGIAPQPAIDEKSVTYTKGTSTAGWDWWGIRYQYGNALVPNSDQNIKCASNPDTSCTLTADISKGKNLNFGTNISKSIDGKTYYCRFDGVWTPEVPNTNPQTKCTNTCTISTSIITPTPTNAPPNCGTISFTGDDGAGKTVPVTAPGTDPNLNQTLTYNWTAGTCGTLASAQTQVTANRPQTYSPSSTNFTCPANGDRCTVNATISDGAATTNCTGAQVCGCGPPSARI